MAGGPLVTATPEEQDRARMALRRLHSEGFRVADMAERFDVSGTYMRKILDGDRQVPDRIVTAAAWLASDEN